MIWSEELQTVGENVLNSPRLTASVATATTSLGLASITEVIHGTLSTCAILAGIVATVLLMRKHWIDYKNAVVQNKILVRQLEKMDAEAEKVS